MEGVGYEGLAGALLVPDGTPQARGQARLGCQ